MLLPRGALLDPSRQQRDLSLGERFACRGTILTSRHSDSRVGRGDACDQLTVTRIARHDREPAVFQRTLRAFFLIEPQRRELRRRSMALEAPVRKDWADVAIELDRRG